MTRPTAALLERTEERLRADPGFASVLAAVLDESSTSSAEPVGRATARALNTTRRAARRDEFRAGALTSTDVQEILGLKTPQAVHARRTRGTLLGARFGDQTWFPAWQLDVEQGRTRPELRRVITLLGRFTEDVVTADRIMRQHHDELGGSIADALQGDDEAAATAWTILGDLGS